MNLRRGDLFLGRFEVLQDEGPRTGSIGSTPEPVDPDATWLRGVDRDTGAAVRVTTRGFPYRWAFDIDVEAFARAVRSLDLPAIVPILHAGPGVVHVEPPPAVPWPSLPLAAAAECALQACEVVAHLHAIGHGGALEFHWQVLRVSAAGDRWRIACIVPRVPALVARARRDVWFAELPDADIDAVFGEHELLDPSRAPIEADIRGLIAFFFSLAPLAAASTRLPAIEMLARAAESPAEVRDVAALAEVFLALVKDRAGHAARTAALPRAASLPRRAYDWDWIIADGERARTHGPIIGPGGLFRGEDWLAVALAIAYHQRAGQLLTAGDPAAALADVEAAIAFDPESTYLITRAIVLDALGRLAEAREAIADVLADEYFDPPRLYDRRERRIQHLYPAAHERARAHAVRGRLALRDGALDDAEADLREAFALHPIAAHAHTLGAILYAQDRLKAAAEFEARSVALEPDNARYRWALIVSLHRLGRDDEARAHARDLPRVAPEMAARCARLLRRAP